MDDCTSIPSVFVICKKNTQHDCRERVTRKRGLPPCGDCSGRGTLCGLCVKLNRCPSLYLVQYLCQSNCVYCSINIHYCVTLNRIVKVIQSAAQCYYCSNYLKLRKVFVINYIASTRQESHNFYY